MSPRIIHIPLSGGDRKAQAKGIRYAHGLHESYFKESVLIRSAAEAKIREADRLECEAWNAVMWAGGPAMPSPAATFTSTWRQSEPRSMAATSQFTNRVLTCRSLRRGRICSHRALFRTPAGRGR